MSKCAVCKQAYTIMYEAGRPICVQCADKLDARLRKSSVICSRRFRLNQELPGNSQEVPERDRLTHSGIRTFEDDRGRSLEGQTNHFAIPLSRISACSSRLASNPNGPGALLNSTRRPGAIK
jgi:hypothetical protein